MECFRTLSEPLSREPFRSPSDRDDLISLCLSLLFTCRYCAGGVDGRRGGEGKRKRKQRKCRERERERGGTEEEVKAALHHFLRWSYC